MQSKIHAQIAPPPEGKRRLGKGFSLLHNISFIQSVEPTFGRNHYQDIPKALTPKFEKFIQYIQTAITSIYTQSVEPAFGRGFTLAEVLITLGIIGVVAALILPGYIENYQKRKVAITLKKSYSELNQALMMGVAENGVNWDYSGNDGIKLWVQEYIEPYIKYEKSASCPNSTAKCLNINKYILLGNPNSEKFKKAGYLLTNPGTATAWWFYFHERDKYVVVKIYVNNPANPMLGRDVFTFVMQDKDKPRFIPFGINGTIPNYTITRDILLKGPIRTGGCFKDSPAPDYYTPGDGCGAVIMLDGWEIKNDYPWYN